jgi:hypothetical protein
MISYKRVYTMDFIGFFCYFKKSIASPFSCLLFKSLLLFLYLVIFIFYILKSIYIENCFLFKKELNQLLSIILHSLTLFFLFNFIFHSIYIKAHMNTYLIYYFFFLLFNISTSVFFYI